MQPEQNNKLSLENLNFAPLQVNMRETELKFHTEPNLMELSATLLGFHLCEAEKIDLIFDRSIFYPNFSSGMSTKRALITAKHLGPADAKVRGIEAPAGKSPRIVTIEGYDDYARGCGGIHVESTDQIGDVTISRVGLKKSVLTITYQIKTTNH